MSKENKKAAIDYQSIISTLLSSSKTLSLATINEFQQPEVSLVPFLFYNNQIWIFVSQLSPHTQHLLKYPNASVLIYKNEAPPKNCFATERINAFCSVHVETEMKEQVLDLMADKLGETISLLRQLGDFSLFSLKPIEGRVIAGFGQAFDIDFSDFSLTHVDPSKG